MRPAWLLLTLSLAALAEPAQTVTDRLSPQTRELVVEEMRSIAAAMGTLHTAIVTGDHRRVIEQARGIHDSFVLRQGLTDSQRQEIADTLPKDFIAADRHFHELAAALSAAGGQGEPALERFYFDEMTRACLACHREFAAGRFAGLDKQSPPASHGH